MLMSRAADDIESRLPGSNAKLRTTERSLAFMSSGLVFGNYDFLEYIILNAIPSEESDPEYIRRFGKNVVQIEDQIPASSQGPIIAVGEVDGAVIPAGTELSNPAGKLYTTNAMAVIAGGVANIDVTATSPGLDGDMASGDTLTFTSPVPDVDADVTVGPGGIIDGTDMESIESYFARMQERASAGGVYGKDGDYAIWAKEVPGVTRAWEVDDYPEEGTIGIVFMLDNSDPPIPNGAKLLEVKNYVYEKAPVNVDVETYAPTLTGVAVKATIFPDTAKVRAAVTDSVKAMFASQGGKAPGKKLYRAKISEAISTSDGEEDHILILPATDLLAGPTELFVFGSIEFIPG